MADLSIENEHFIDDAVASGRFESRSDAINEAVLLLRDQCRENGQRPAETITAEEWCQRFERWAADHRHLAQEADDSRESIYAGRGE